MDVLVEYRIDLIKFYQNWATWNYPSLSNFKVKHHESSYKPWYDIDRCKACFEVSCLYKILHYHAS